MKYVVQKVVINFVYNHEDYYHKNVIQTNEYYYEIHYEIVLMMKILMNHYVVVYS